NAVKYGGHATPITVDLSRAGTSARFVVEDHGIGMADDEVAHIFEPFFRGSAARDGGLSGTGLGLAVATRLAKVFGGKISVASKLGHGSQFEVSLPIAAEPANAQQPEALIGPLEERV